MIAKRRLEEKKEKEDTYAQSIVHTNQVSRKKYGKAQRKVPAHMPHLIDVGQMEALQEIFEDGSSESDGQKYIIPIRKHDEDDGARQSWD